MGLCSRLHCFFYFSPCFLHFSLSPLLSFPPFYPPSLPPSSPFHPFHPSTPPSSPSLPPSLPPPLPLPPYLPLNRRMLKTLLSYTTWTLSRPSPNSSRFMRTHSALLSPLASLKQAELTSLSLLTKWKRYTLQCVHACTCKVIK